MRKQYRGRGRVFNTSRQQRRTKVKEEDLIVASNLKNIQTSKQLAALLTKRFGLIKDISAVTEFLTEKEKAYIKSIAASNNNVWKELKKAFEELTKLSGDLSEAATSQYDYILDMVKGNTRNVSLNETLLSVIQQQRIEILEAAKTLLQTNGLTGNLAKKEKAILQTIRDKNSVIGETVKLLTLSEDTTLQSSYALRSQIEAMEELRDLIDIGRSSKASAIFGEDLTPKLKSAVALAKQLGIPNVDDNIESWEKLYETIAETNQMNLTASKDILRTLKQHLFISEKIRDTTSSIESRFDSVKGILMFIPGFGQKAAASMDVFRDATVNVVKELGDAIRKGEGLTTGLSNAWKRFNIDTQGAISTAGKFKLGLMAMGAISLKLLIEGLKLAYDLFKELADTTNQISQATGLSTRQAYELAKASTASVTSATNYLSTLKDISELQTSLVQATGRLIPISADAASNLSNMAKLFGISQDEAGKLEARLRQMGADEELSQALQFATAELAEANKLAPGVITKDVVQNGELLAKSFAGASRQAMLATVEVHKLGYSLSDAAKVMDHLFNVESSLTAQMEASVGLNRMIDLSYARQLALQGDVAGMMKEIAFQAGSYESFTRMSVPQRILLARAAGVEVDTLERSLYLQKFSGQLTDEEIALIEEKKMSLTEIKKLNGKELKDRVDAIKANEVFSAQWSKIKTELGRALLPLLEKIAEVLIDVVIPAANALVQMIRGLTAPIKALTSLLSGDFTAAGEAIKSAFSGSFTNVLLSTIGLLIGIPTAIFAIGTAVNTVAGLFSGMWKIIKGIGKGIGGIAKFITGKSGGVAVSAAGTGTPPPGAPPGVPGGTGTGSLTNPSSPSGPPGTRGESLRNRNPRRAQGRGGRGRGLAGNVGEMAQNLQGRVSGVSGAGEGVRGFLTGLSDGLKELGTKPGQKFIGVLVLTAASAAIAGPFALAIYKLKDVNPGVMFGFSATIFALGLAFKLISSLQKDIFAGTFAIVAASLGIGALAFGLSYLDKGIDLNSALGLSVLIGAIGVAFILASSLKENILKGAGALGIAAVTIGGLAYALSYLDKGINLNSVLGFSGAILAIGGAFSLASAMKDKIVNGSIAFVIMGAAMIPLAYAFNLMEDIKYETAAILAGGMIALGFALKAASSMKGNAVAAGFAFTLIGSSALLLAHALNTMKNVKYETVIMLGSVMAGLTGALAIISNMKGSALSAGVAMLAISAGAAILAYGLSQLKGVDPSVLLSFGVVVMEVGTVGAVLSQIPLTQIVKGAVGLALLGAALIPFAWSLSMLKGFDTNAALATVIAIGGIALEVGIIGAALVATGGLGALALGAGALALVGIGAALIPLAKSFSYLKGVDFSSVSKFIERLRPLASGMKKLSKVETRPILEMGRGLTSIVTTLKQSDVVMEKFYVLLNKFTPDMFSVVAQGIKEIGKALKSIDIKYLESLGLLAGLSFVDVPKGKNATASTPKASSIEDQFTVKAAEPTGPVIDPNTAFQPSAPSTAPASTTATNITPVTIGGNKTDILLTRIATALERSLASPTPVVIQFDDRTLKQLSTSIIRATN